MRQAPGGARLAVNGRQLSTAGASEVLETRKGPHASGGHCRPRPGRQGMQQVQREGQSTEGRAWHPGRGRPLLLPGKGVSQRAQGLRLPGRQGMLRAQSLPPLGLLGMQRAQSLRLPGRCGGKRAQSLPPAGRLGMQRVRSLLLPGRRREKTAQSPPHPLRQEKRRMQEGHFLGVAMGSTKGKGQRRRHGEWTR